MTTTTRVQVFGWAATVLAGAAAAIGLLGTIYRDVPASVDQAKGTDLATLFVAVPLLVIALWAAGHGSGAGRVVAAGGLAYLAYTYAIYAFQVVINPLTPVHIAILGLSTWSLILGVPAMRSAVIDVGAHLPRRATAAFLVVVAVMFASLWLSQIFSAIITGVLPVAISDVHLPTSAVFTLDLAFALPVFILAAVLLGRRHPLANALGLGALVFTALMGLSIIGLFAMEAANGSLTDPSMLFVFTIVAAIGAILAGRGLLNRVNLPGAEHLAPGAAH